MLDKILLESSKIETGIIPFMGLSIIDLVGNLSWYVRPMEGVNKSL